MISEDRTIINLREFPSYIHKTITESNDFYNTLLKASELADTKHESSFAVYGSGNGFKFTKPLQELEDQCRVGTDNATGINYSKPGYGKYVPKGKFSLFDVHFHNPDNIAIPSHGDLESQLSQSCMILVIKGCPHMIFGTDIIGHRDRKGNITLFCSQLKENVYLTLYDAGLDQQFLKNVGANIDAFAYKDGKLIVNDHSLPEKAAKVLRSTGRYNAAVISFAKQKDYMAELKKLREFSICGLADFDEDSFSRQIQKRRTFLDDLDDEFINAEEERNRRECGIEPLYDFEGFQVSDI